MTAQEIKDRAIELVRQIEQIDKARIELIGRIDELNQVLKDKIAEDNIWNWNDEEEKKEEGNGRITEQKKR